MCDTDLMQLKLAQLRVELQKRGLDAKGNNLVLIERLKETMLVENAAAGGKPIHSSELTENEKMLVELLSDTAIEGLPLLETEEDTKAPPADPVASTSSLQQPEANFGDDEEQRIDDSGEEETFDIVIPSVEEIKTSSAQGTSYPQSRGLPDSVTQEMLAVQTRLCTAVENIEGHINEVKCVFRNSELYLKSIAALLETISKAEDK